MPISQHAPDWLAATAAVRPHALALIADGQRLTFLQLNRAAESLATRLATANIRQGTFVPALLPNGIDAVLLIHALAKLGAVIVPLNTRLTTDELRWQMTHLNGRVLVHHASTANQAAQVAAGLYVQPIDLSSTRPHDTASALQADHLPHAAETTSTTPDGLQAIVFTSGTSGHPKAAMLTWDNHFWSATASAFRLGVLPEDRWLCVLPLYHVGGLAIILRSALYGTAVVLHNGFEPETITRSLHNHQITLISLVPTMLYRMLSAGATFPESLRLILLGGAAASTDLLALCQEYHLPVAPTYGLSEACSQVATLPPHEMTRKSGSVGKPLTFTTVEIIDEAGDLLPAGAYGEVVVHGPTVFAGYYKAPEATARALRGGRLFTGDIGYVDSEGDLWIVQRRSDLIVSGGENVYPAEVERVLKSHHAVQDAAVVGIPSAEWGQQVAAAVVLKPGERCTESDLLAYSRQHLAGYKQPRVIRFVELLPQTASGKIQRTAVAALFSSSG